MRESSVEAPPPEADVNDDGVDLAQVRHMLSLTPAERLATMAAFIGSLRGHLRSDEDRGSG